MKRRLYDSLFKWDKRLPVLGFIIAVMLVLAMVLLGAGFLLGQRAVGTDTTGNPGELRAIQSELTAAQASLRSREESLEVQRIRHDVDRKALEMVRQELADQKEQIAELEEGLRFYRGLMTPGKSDHGLILGQIELVPGLERGQYSFKILVQQQDARKHAQVKGDLTVAVIGVQGEQPAEYSLADIRPESNSNAIALSFRYFQSVEGEMTLPEGFSPSSVSVVVRAVSPQKLEVTEQFPWQLQERFSHVGK